MFVLLTTCITEYLNLQKLGFKEAIFPKSNINKKIEKLDIISHPVKKIKEAFQIILNKN